MSDLSVSINELTYENQLNNFYKENQNMKQSIETKDNVSEGSVSSHVKSNRCYRFQQLKSHNANIRKADVGSKTSVSSSTATITTAKATKKANKLSINSPQTKIVSKSNKWCVGQFICMPQKKLKQIPEPTNNESAAMDQTNDSNIPPIELSNNNAVNDNDNNDAIDDDDDDAFLSTSITDNQNVYDKNIELMKKLEENETKILNYENIIKEMEQNKITTLNEYENMKLLHDKQTSVITDLMNRTKSLKLEYENQFKIKNDEIENSKKKHDELQCELNKTNDKLQMITLTEELLHKQGNKNRDEINKLKSINKQLQSDYDLKIKEFNSYIDKKNKQHSDNIKKVINILDNYKNSQFETMEMHGDLEYIIGLVETSIVTFKEEIETLKFENKEKTQIIENLMRNVKEKAIFDQNMENAIKLLIQEKIEAYYSLWQLSYCEKLNTLKTINKNDNLLVVENQQNNTTKPDMEDMDNEHKKNIVGDILDSIGNEIEQTETPNAISVVCPPTPNNGVFELESISLEKLDTNTPNSEVSSESEEVVELNDHLELKQNSKSNENAAANDNSELEFPN